MRGPPASRERIHVVDDLGDGLGERLEEALPSDHGLVRQDPDETYAFGEEQKSEWGSSPFRSYLVLDRHQPREFIKLLLIKEGEPGFGEWKAVLDREKSRFLALAETLMRLSRTCEDSTFTRSSFPTSEPLAETISISLPDGSETSHHASYYALRRTYLPWPSLGAFQPNQDSVEVLSNKILAHLKTVHGDAVRNSPPQWSRIFLRGFITRSALLSLPPWRQRLPSAAGGGRTFMIPEITGFPPGQAPFLFLLSPQGSGAFSELLSAFGERGKREVAASKPPILCWLPSTWRFESDFLWREEGGGAG